MNHYTSSKTPIWRAIFTALSGEISEGIYATGDKLPTEAALSRRFGVNRHTVRHALAEMATQGLVVSRRGAGVFVTGTPTDYPIGKRVRFHQNITAAGRTPAKEVLDVTTRRAAAAEAEALDLEPQEMVHCYEGLSLADGMPLALFQSVFPAGRFANLPQALTEAGSVTQAMRADGVTDYTRAWTRLTAKRATATQAGLLRIEEGAPILRSVSVNVDLAGAPVEYGRTWFVGDRVTLTLNDP
ncbi:phosphonate metabolism transcriptional regulator PhnF [uncultured Roseobacter sp.]|uniref:phosphonate metabolism transcriptional regulator PhnF n=1 Tax=uncultured Roseobacter sp. TaxID=114847 RepID=UPI00262BE68A|nr:phosphonate metabolism transcriptional regulator PhnF [uncultured Roseobacter sp.]